VAIKYCCYLFVQGITINLPNACLLVNPFLASEILFQFLSVVRRLFIAGNEKSIRILPQTQFLPPNPGPENFRLRGWQTGKYAKYLSGWGDIISGVPNPQCLAIQTSIREPELNLCG